MWKTAQDAVSHTAHSPVLFLAEEKEPITDKNVVASTVQIYAISSERQHNHPNILAVYDGGTEPVWSRDGRELFYVNGDKMMVVEITTAPAFRAGTPRLLFEGRYLFSPNGVAAYDVASDGQRLLRVQPIHPDPPTNQIQVVQNWFEELKRLVPSN